jgi:hypothetical protein
MIKKMILLNLLLVQIGMIFGAPPKNETAFKRLSKDEPSDQAVLIFTVKVENSKYPISGGAVYFSRDAAVYSCPMTWYTPKRDAVTKLYSGEMTYYYLTAPGQADIALIDVETKNGSYTTWVSFPLRGQFNMDAGSVNYVGEIEVDLSASASAIQQNESTFSEVTSKFKNDFPAISGASKGIAFVNLSPSIPLKPAGEIFADDFSKSSSSWQITTDNLHHVTFSDGALVLDNQGADSSVVLKSTIFPGSFEVEAACSWISGESNKGYGVIIGNDPVNCLKFTITSGGYFSIFRWLPKKELKWIAQDVVGWTKSDLVHTGPGEKNVLRVQKTEWEMHTVGMIAFYINDNLAARNVYYVSPPTIGSGTQFKKEGVVGMFSYGKQVIAWDDFKVSGL